MPPGARLLVRTAVLAAALICTGALLRGQEVTFPATDGADGGFAARMRRAP